MQMRFIRRGLTATAFVALLATGVSTASAQDAPTSSKIGFVSLDRILRDSAPAKAAQTKLESEFSKRQKDLQDTSARLKAAADKFDKDSPVLSDSDRGPSPARAGRHGQGLPASSARVQRGHQPAQERGAGRRSSTGRTA